MRSSSEWYASTSTRPSGSSRCTDSSSPAGEVRQLAVHLHADGLEGAARRVATAAAGGGGDAALHRLDELTGASCSGRAATISAAIAARVALLAVAGDERGEVGLRVLVRRPSPRSASARCPCACRAARRRPSTRSPAPDGRAAGCSRPGRTGSPRFPRFPRCRHFPRCRRLLEAAVHDAGPVPEGLERRARRRDGGGVPVDAEEPEVGAGGRGVARAWPPPPTVASTTSPGRHGGQELHHLRRHDREVLKGLAPSLPRPRSRPVVLFPGTATSPPDASTKAKRAEGALAPRRPGGWWRARRPAVVNVSLRSDAEVGQVVGLGERLRRPSGRARASAPGPRSRCGRRRPTTITSRSRPAKARRFAGNATRPCLSGLISLGAAEERPGRR